jgi:hypothetical protein
MFGFDQSPAVQRLRDARRLVGPATGITGQLRTYSPKENGDPKAAAVDVSVTGYAFLRLDIPISPSRPEPNNQTAAGTGTTVATA